MCFVAKKRYQAVGFPCNRMLKLSSSRGIRIDVPVLSVSWSFVYHSVIIQVLRKGLFEREASDTGGIPRWKSSCPDRQAEATRRTNGRVVNETALSTPFHAGSAVEKNCKNKQHTMNTTHETIDPICTYHVVVLRTTVPDCSVLVMRSMIE